MKRLMLAVFVFQLLIDGTFQQVNLSSNGTTSQSSTLYVPGKNFGSHLAVDANLSNKFEDYSCAITAAYKYEAWWKLIFPVNTVFITNVSIIYRSDTLPRFSFYSLYVSNSTVSAGSSIDDHLCYKHTGPEYPNEIENRDCSAMGQNVIIYNKRNQSKYSKEIDSMAYIELCDVKVFGCYKGWQGPNCATECPVNCIDKHCHPKNGNCIWGCRPDNCLTKRCDKSTGACIDGCKLGLTGDMCEHKDNSALIGGVVGGTCGFFLAAIIILMIIIRRRSKGNKNQNQTTDPLSVVKEEDSILFRKGSGPETKKEEVYVNVSMALDPEDAAATDDLSNSENSLPGGENDEATDEVSVSSDDAIYNNDSDKHIIPISELESIIEEKKRNEGFAKEYSKFPKGLMHSHEEASKKENLIKNRFLNTYPYDHSRVVLRGNPSSDYINASYIDSYSKEKAYIATQGPKKGTIKDFWLMIWQENVDVIAMLTGIIEQGKRKCEPYWADDVNTPSDIGIFKVSTLQEATHTVYDYRKIKIFNKKAKSGKIVHHFHFTQWPDHGIPERVKLVSFYRKVKPFMTSSNRPTLVHCSAGVGRTGTFIAIDALYEQGKRTGYVDIADYVQMMRKDRMDMIQTGEQYTVLFEALLELFTVPETSIPIDTFIGYFGDNKNSLKKEFQTLEDLKPVYDNDSFKSARSKENSQKNVVKNILPHDNFRPYLMSYEKNRNNYINAVIIPEYVEKTNFIVTQYPTAETLIDFWTLVYDNDCSTVVLLEEDENVQLWPEKDSELNFQIFSLKQSTDSSSMPLAVSLLHKESQGQRTIGVFSMQDWNSDNIPSSPTAILELLNNVSSWKKEHLGSTVVICRDGCSRCGMFVALGLTKERMERDNEVDIFQVVRAMQQRRPQFLSNFEQYEFCYMCIMKYLEGNFLYANT